MTEPLDDNDIRESVEAELDPRWAQERPSREGPWTRGGTIAGAVAALAAVATLGYAVLQSQTEGPGASLPTGTPTASVTDTQAVPTQEPTPTSPATTPAAVIAPGTTPESTADGTEQAVGDCLDADARAVDCLQPHTSQVFSLSPDCQLEALRDFLGTSELDVIRPDVSSLELADSSACLVALEGGEPIAGSLEGSFSESRSSHANQLRHCLDGDLDPVACDVPHHGEVVGTAAEAQSCPSVAASYLGWESSGLPTGLALEARGSQQPECLITVKGENALTDTLRDIGRRSLPIAALG